MIILQASNITLDLMQLHLFDQLTWHFIPLLHLILSMFQVHRNKTEHSIIQHEALWNSTFVSYHLTKSFSNFWTFHFCLTSDWCRIVLFHSAPSWWPAHRSLAPNQTLAAKQSSRKPFSQGRPSAPSSPQACFRQKSLQLRVQCRPCPCSRPW